MRPTTKAAKVAKGVRIPLMPSARQRPHSPSEAVKPVIPSSTIFRRPARSDRFAQKGALSIHNSADTEKTAATALSAACSSRPSAGRIDCSAVLPAAISSITPNSNAKSRSIARLMRGATHSCARRA